MVTDIKESKTADKEKLLKEDHNWDRDIMDYH